MTAQPIDADVLRRYFVAIATSSYDDPTLGNLKGVEDEVRTLTSWLCDEKLGGRRFTPQYAELADNPTKQQVRDALEDPVPSRKWRGTDAAVLFVTGHGIPRHGTHWLVLRRSNSGALKSTALRTADLVGWLTETKIEHLLLVLDACFAGKAAGDTVQFDEELPRTWLVVASTAKNQTAVTGALTTAIQELLEELGGPVGEKYGVDPYLRVEDFLSAIEEKLGDDQRVIPLQGSQIRGPHVCLPNPHYRPDDAAPVTPSRHDLALPKSDLEAHWGPRSRGVTGREDPGWLFTGRGALMRRLIDAATGKPGVLLVTGGAGSGKSAVLARLVTLSDPEFRGRYADEVALIDEDLKPPPEAVDIAVLATGKNAPEIMAQICRATGALPADGSSPSLEDARTAWQQWIAQRDRPVTIVVDALDEATNPTEVLTGAMQHLQPADASQRNVRLLVGVRSTGGPGHGDLAAPEGSKRRQLADLAQDLLRADPERDRIRVDEPPWWVRVDVVDYVTSLLHAPAGSPYLSDDTGATKAVAEAIADAAGTSFLVAKMASEQLAARGEVVNVDNPAWRASINAGVLGVFRDDLHHSLPDPDERLRAVHLLRAVAFAYGRGLPWRNIWPLVANAVADEPGLYGDRDIAWLLGTRLGGYLVTDREDDVTVYRLFHDDLRMTLREQWRDLLDGAAP